MLPAESVLTILKVYVVRTQEIKETCAANPGAKSLVVEEQIIYSNKEESSIFSRLFQ